MNKTYLEYKDLKRMLLEKIPLLEELNINEIIAVSRGGITIAHILGKALNLKVGYLFPDKKEIYFNNPSNKHILIVEDLIAEGRTTKIIKKMMDEKYSDIHYTYMPFLVDANYKDKDYDIKVMRSSEWIVFPWEEFEKMNEGDRGLFRDGTDSYGAQNQITK